MSEAATFFDKKHKSGFLLKLNKKYSNRIQPVFLDIA